MDVKHHVYLPITQSSGAVWKSRWPSWDPVPNKPTVSVHVKQHSTTTNHTRRHSYFIKGRNANHQNTSEKLTTKYSHITVFKIHWFTAEKDTSMQTPWDFSTKLKHDWSNQKYVEVTAIILVTVSHVLVPTDIAPTLDTRTCSACEKHRKLN